MFFASFNRGVGQGGATFRSLILQKKQRIIKDQEHFQKQPWKLVRTNDFFLLTRLLAAATAPSISDMSVKPMKCQQKACCDPTAVATHGAAAGSIAQLLRCKRCCNATVALCCSRALRSNRCWIASTFATQAEEWKLHVVMFRSLGSTRLWLGPRIAFF